MVYLATMSLDRYGYKEDARRIAQKYIDVTVNLFEKTGRLWEKTDAETDGLASVEYGSAPMMGWTAGVFVALAEYCS